MALIFCDGFDHYATKDMLKKWDYFDVDYFYIDNINKRTGNGALRSSATYAKVMGKYLQNNFQTLVFGVANNLTTIPDKDQYIGYSFLVNKDINIDVRIYYNYFVKIYRGTTLLGTSTVPITIGNEWFYLEIKIYLHDTEGYVIIRKNGEIFYKLNSIKTRNSIEYCNHLRIRVQDYNAIIDDLYIDDSNFLGDIKVETLCPSGAGTTTQWDALSGNNYENVDEVSQDGDTSYVSTATANEIDTYAFGNLTTTSGTVYGVQVNMTARKDDAGSRSIAPVVRLSSTDRIGNSVSVSDSYVNHIQMYNTNPDDSEAWTIADVNGAEFGVKLIE